MFERLLDIIGAWVATLFVAASTLLFGSSAAIAPPPSPPALSSTTTPVSIALPPVEPVLLNPPPAAPVETVKIPAPKKIVSVPKPKVTPLLSPPPPAPPPVKAVVPVVTPDVPSNEGGALTAADIFTLTNVERSKQGLAPLIYNKKLAVIAEAKAMDMIKQQYFEHKSPQGIDIGGLAEQYDYVYSHIGENLALGDFTSSTHVVKGWMDSPGHRANILNVHYAEIGIAAIVGKWEGREVWFAVQEFGTPLPDCVKPDPLLYTKIEIFQTQIEAMESTLAKLKAEIDAGTGTPQERSQKVDDYNTIVSGYNKLIVTERDFISEYNAAVKSYNTCMNI